MKPDNAAFPSAEDYGRSLKGFGVNLLVRDVARSVAFAQDVLGAEAAYVDKDFAVLRYRVGGQLRAEWMLHADGTYHSHPLLGLIRDDVPRGAGAELRLYDCDPDRAVRIAGEKGFMVLSPPIDSPHGLREAFILDGDGYCWVPCVPKKSQPSG
jgi:catechol 2,3-dioxygenase-like lactoylglutathione lyase family enzyme